MTDDDDDDDDDVQVSQTADIASPVQESSLTVLVLGGGDTTCLHRSTRCAPQLNFNNDCFREPLLQCSKLPVRLFVQMRKMYISASSYQLPMNTLVRTTWSFLCRFLSWGVITGIVWYQMPAQRVCTLHLMLSFFKYRLGSCMERAKARKGSGKDEMEQITVPCWTLSANGITCCVEGCTTI